MPETIPVIDLADFISSGRTARDSVGPAIDAACRDVGFLLVTGHGVPDALLQRMHDVSAEFFALPAASKRSLEIGTNSDLGWKGPGQSYLANTLTRDEAGGPPADWKESFGARPIAPWPNLTEQERGYFVDMKWPAGLPAMEAIYSAYFGHMERLGATIMSAFAVSLGLDSDYFDSMIDRHLSVLSVHNYPAQPNNPRPGQLRAGAHTDFGPLTILHPGRNPGGLQVQDRTGAWADVTPRWENFVVNIGDLMAQWTNDRWVSTMHRVVNPPRDRAHLARQSLTFFYAPNWDAVVECPPGCSGPGNPVKYQPIAAGAHIEAKMARLRDLAA
jgi:isopenicillin N synthase-like dioxygenase